VTAPPGRWWRSSSVLLVLFVALQLPFLFQPIGGVHKWRQADTAAVARHFAVTNADIRFPRVDVRVGVESDATGITGMEFPLYQWLVALPMRASGSDADGIGKVVALLFAVVAWVALSRLMVRELSLEPWPVHFALAESTLLFVYASRVMPETTALAAAVVGVERTTERWRKRSPAILVHATAAFAVAALVRPYATFLGLPLAVASVRAWSSGEGTRAVQAFAAGALALIPAAVWYGWWSPRLVRVYRTDYFFVGNPICDVIAGMAHIQFWADLGKVLAQDYAGWAALPVAAVGLWRVPRVASAAREPWLAWTYLAGVPALTLPALLVVIGHHFRPHRYYLLALLPCAIALIAIGLQDLARRRARALPWVGSALLVANFAAHVHVYRGDREYRRFDSVRSQVAASVRPGDPVVIQEGGAFAFTLHPLRLTGWVVDRARLDDPDWLEDMARRRGVRWVLPLEEGSYRLESLTVRVNRLRSPSGVQPRPLDPLPGRIS